MSKSKKENELEPQIEQIGNTDETDNTLINIAEDIKKSTHIISTDKEDDDSFYKSIVRDLNSKKNLGTKTEYIGTRETYMGSRASFLGKFCNVPYLVKFIDIFEEKRISLDRKGRKELIMALQERRQEIERQKADNFSKMFNVT